MWRGPVAFVKEEQHALDETAGLFHAGLLPVFGQAFADGVFEAVLPVDHALENVREKATGQVARRVPMGQAAGLGGVVKGVSEECTRRSADQGATALAVVLGDSAHPLAGLKRREAGGARGSA